MRVTRLKLVNLRAIEAMEFGFQPGCNLIVGVNGVGKTSVLDALAVCLSAVVKDANRLRTPVESFDVDDIRVGADALTLECGLQHWPKRTHLSHSQTTRDECAAREEGWYAAETGA